MNASVAISYHTESDAAWVEALTQAFEREGVGSHKLNHLTLSGFSLPDGPGGGLRRDGWIAHFADILAESVGMIVMHSQSSRESEETPGRGMWIERELATQFRGSLKDYMRVIQVPVQGPNDLWSQASWVSEQMGTLIPWVEGRTKAGPPGLARFESQVVNIAQPYLNHELQFAVSTGQPYPGYERRFDAKVIPWFFISVLDLYDRVWHCRNCLATSDVWMAPECRPPARCPACGYSGEHGA